MLRKICAFVLFCQLLSAAEYNTRELRITTVKGKEAAAGEFLYHWEKIAGCKPVKTPGALHVVIGQMPPKGKAPKRGESRWLYRKGTLYFWGDDGGERKGTVFAVYDFLENKFGVRWIYPGEDGVFVPECKKFSLQEREGDRRRPPFLWTGVRGSFWRARKKRNYTSLAPKALQLSNAEVAAHSAENFLFLQRMRHGRVQKIRYGHAFGDWADRFGKTHPEYFGMDPYGIHRPLASRPGRSKLCVSNPAVADQIVADWEKAGKPRYWNVCPNDGSLGFCHCANCMALDCRKPEEGFLDHLTDRYLHFWNKLIGKMIKKRSDVVLVSYIYSFYRFPPRREKVEYPDNLLCGIVPSITEDNTKLFSEWKKAGLKKCFLRPNDLCSTFGAVRGLEKRIYDKFQQARMFQLLGTDYDSSLGRPGLDLESYIASRMVAFPDKSFETLYAEYCSAYGSAAEVVRKAHDLVRHAGEAELNRAKNKKENKLLLDDSMIKFGNMEMVTASSKALELVKAHPLDKEKPDVRKRLKRLQLVLEHSILVHRFFASQKNPEELEKAAGELLKFRIENRTALPEFWEYLFAGNERPLWRITRCGNSFLQKSAAAAVDLSSGWRSSFDIPSLDGWAAGKAFSRITTQEASFDRYGVEVKSGSGREVVLFREGVTVVPKAAYTLSFDAKCCGRTKFYLQVKDGKKLLTQLTVTADKPMWSTGMVKFSIPAGCKSVSMYLLRDPAPQKSWIDKIEFRKEK